MAGDWPVVNDGWLIVGGDSSVVDRRWLDVVTAKPGDGHW
jgi:hypothetical protein